MTVEYLKTQFAINKEARLFGRYICNEHIRPLMKKMHKIAKVSLIGKSVLGEDIHTITIGYGPKKILIWSQMHGNESTTTKALFDLLNFLGTKSQEAKNILNQCTIKIIPILNPDGAKAYTRINANEVDLNRDAQEVSQPESILLREVFNDFSPLYCFNLHGQRTIFSAGHANKSAIVSFLAPSQNEERSVTPNRKVAMEIIGEMNSYLQLVIPENIGLYDDSFNLNCVGDTFQSLGVPTILFEAGHYPGDYDREKTRELIFHAFVFSLNYISNNLITGECYESYLNIPFNQKLFYDLIIRNVQVNEGINDVAIQFQEQLKNGKIIFLPKVEKIGGLDGFFGHREINASNHPILTHDMKPIFEGYENVFGLMKNEKIQFNITNT